MTLRLAGGVVVNLSKNQPFPSWTFHSSFLVSTADGCCFFLACLQGFKHVWDSQWWIWWQLQQLLKDPQKTLSSLPTGGPWSCSLSPCWWFSNPANQSKLVDNIPLFTVYSCCIFSYPRLCWPDFWTINSTTRLFGCSTMFPPPLGISFPLL